jgi:hypothetical protein
MSRALPQTFGRTFQPLQDDALAAVGTPRTAEGATAFASIGILWLGNLGLSPVGTPLFLQPLSTHIIQLRGLEASHVLAVIRGTLLGQDGHLCPFQLKKTSVFIDPNKTIYF